MSWAFHWNKNNKCYTPSGVLGIITHTDELLSRYKKQSKQMVSAMPYATPNFQIYILLFYYGFVFVLHLGINFGTTKNYKL